MTFQNQNETRSVNRSWIGRIELVARKDFAWILSFLIPLTNQLALRAVASQTTEGKVSLKNLLRYVLFYFHSLRR